MPNRPVDCLAAQDILEEVMGNLDALKAKLKERFKNVRKGPCTEVERLEYLRNRPVPSFGVMPSTPPTEQERKERDEYIKLHKCPF